MSWKKDSRPSSCCILGMDCKELQIRNQIVLSSGPLVITKYCAIHCQHQADLVSKSKTLVQNVSHMGTADPMPSICKSYVKNSEIMQNMCKYRQVSCNLYAELP